VKLPFADQAVVEGRKITHYLLSETHAEGRGKARFFRSLGFDSGRPDQLRASLLQLAATTEVGEVSFEHGLKYVGDANLTGPNGRSGAIRVIWTLRGGAPPPFFTSAYPVTRRHLV